MCFANEFGEILPGKRFALPKSRFQNAKRGRVTNDSFPLVRRELAKIL
jgi:hypothetical protein